MKVHVCPLLGRGRDNAVPSPGPLLRHGPGATFGTGPGATFGTGPGASFWDQPGVQFLDLPGSQFRARPTAILQGRPVALLGHFLKLHGLSRAVFSAPGSAGLAPPSGLDQAGN